jgi:group I intron endonuclease
VDLAKRFRTYYDFNYISEKQRVKSLINRALLKHGYDKFSLEILEYCEPAAVISMEQHYLDLLKPEYNILKIAGSLLGYKHSLDTIAKLKAKFTGITRTPEHKAKLLEHLRRLHSNKEYQERLKERSREGIKIINANPEHKSKNLERLKIYNASKEHKEHLKHLQASRSNRVEVLDTLTNQITVYPSISEAARAIGCHKTTISKTLQHLKEKGVSRPINKRFTVKPTDDK